MDTLSKMTYACKHNNKIYFQIGALIYSVPCMYSKLMDDPRSWDKSWIDSFGRNGAIRTEWMFLRIKPSEQPCNVGWFIQANTDIHELELEKTAEYNKSILSVMTDKVFKKFESLKRSLNAHELNEHHD